MQCRWLQSLLISALIVTLGGCSQLSFLAANTPATFGHYSRLKNISYAAQSRNLLDVYEPEASHTHAPIVIFVHGGGWNDGDKAQYKFVGVALAEQGYVAVLPNYGLYPHVKSPVFVQDIAAAVVFVHDHAAEWGGDPQRIYLMGHSAGAQIAMMVALDDEYLQQAGGDSHWLRGVVGLSGPYDFLPFTRDYMSDLFGPPDRYAQSQPVNYARANAPPLLLLQGLQDHTVAPTNTRHLLMAMQAVGGKVEAEYFPDASHSDMLAAFSFVRKHKPPIITEVNKFIATEDATLLPNSQAVAKHGT